MTTSAPLAPSTVDASGVEGFPFLLRIPAATAALKVGRAAVRSWCETINRPLHDWDVVVTELLANAVQAAPDAHSIEVRFGLSVDEVTTSRRVVCSVKNDGEWEEVRDDAPVPLSYLAAKIDGGGEYEPCGRGLKLIAALTSGGMINISDGATDVTVWLDEVEDGAAAA